MVYILVLLSLITAFGFTILMERVALRYGFVAVPQADTPLDHPPTALLGGIATISVIAMASVVLHFTHGLPLYALGALGVVLALGLYKDWVRSAHVDPLGQLCVQATAVVLLIASENPLDLNLPFATEFALSLTIGLSIINAINFIDVMDGLAGGVSLIAFAFYGLLAVHTPSSYDRILALVCVAATVGFLVRNWPPAKIFMGDTGSFGLGLLLTYFVFSGAGDGPLLLVWLLPLSAPLIELIFTITLRIVSGKVPTVGDSQHMSLILLSRGVSQRGVLTRAYALSIVAGMTALAIATFGFASG